MHILISISDRNARLETAIPLKARVACFSNSTAWWLYDFSIFFSASEISLTIFFSPRYLVDVDVTVAAAEQGCGQETRSKKAAMRDKVG